MHDTIFIGAAKTNLHMSEIAITDVLTLYEAIENALVVSIEEIKAENLVLKATIEMLENDLNMCPLLMTLFTIQTQQSTIPTATTSLGSIRALQLVNVVKCHVVGNISRDYKSLNTHDR